LLNASALGEQKIAEFEETRVGAPSLTHCAATPPLHPEETLLRS
jgi:hypothetical protein